MIMTEKILIWVASYLLGSIPFALLLVKIFYNKDLRKAGSGNIGARNAFDVTNSKIIGIAVFILDFLKGFLGIYFAYRFTNNESIAVLISGLLVVLGHNFSIYIGFKGGRGLAVSAGLLLGLQPIILIFWCVFWVIIYRFGIKNLHFANFFATIVSPFVFYFLPFETINNFALIKIESKILLFIFLALLSLLVIIKHIKPLRQQLG